MSNLDDYTPTSPPTSSETMEYPTATSKAEIVYLKVGQTTYSIQHETLFKFEYFNDITPPCDILILDANEEVFPHIIAYLRRGTYPLVIDAKGRHDIPTYLAILEEAKCLQLKRLAEWLEKGRYVEAARVECTTTILEEGDLGTCKLGRTEALETAITSDNPTSDDTTSDNTIKSTISEECFPAWGKKLVYRCPREKHNGNRVGCGRKCYNALGGEAGNYDEAPMFRVVEVKKELVVDPKLCRDEKW
ncbi:hypothetical protein IMZ48_03385 [Candidatus Bathyarchaeota archaeon]|nr:hypothetical protein [Candidatus Bathyarchaeota archaeon]